MDLIEFRYCQRMSMIKLRSEVPDAVLQYYSSDEVETMAYIYNQVGNLVTTFKLVKSMRENIKNPL